MNGFEAINANNGWAMAFVGITIVFSGLVALSFVISQLKNIFKYFENTGNPGKNSIDSEHVSGNESKTNDTKLNIDSRDNWLLSIEDAAILYKPLFEKLGDTFELGPLYDLARQNNFPHPHLTIKSMREAEILIPTGTGTFTCTI